MIQEQAQGRSLADSAWLAGSFACLALSGVCINLVIALGYGSAALGLFNLTFAIYIFAAQFAVFGTQYAALYYISIHAGNERAKDAALTALLCGALYSCIVTFVVYGLRDFAADLMQSPDLAHSLGLAAAGLIFFSANKIFLNILNARNQIRNYALGTAMRYAGLVLCVLVFTLLSLPAWSIAAALPCAELCAFVWLWVCCRHSIAWRISLRRMFVWSRRVCGYGARAFATGVIAELNTRVDILILGYFATDAVVGLYSFVALLSEGLGQLPILGRIYNDPVIARLWAAQRMDELNALVRRTRIAGWASMICICAVVWFFYEPVLALTPNGAEYVEATPVFALLLFGVAASSGYVPLSDMLQQTGYPGRQSAQVACVFFLNVAGNLVLVPFWGMYGAAVGLALSQLGMIWILRGFVRRTLHFAI
jgi:O-antigen/teichoic acid export membrane protein